MRPVPFLASLVPAIAALVSVIAAGKGMSWIEAGGLFYGWLALAELAYLALVFIRYGVFARAAAFSDPHDRRA